MAGRLARAAIFAVFVITSDVDLRVPFRFLAFCGTPPFPSFALGFAFFSTFSGPQLFPMGAPIPRKSLSSQVPFPSALLQPKNVASKPCISGYPIGGLLRVFGLFPSFRRYFRRIILRSAPLAFFGAFPFPVFALGFRPAQVLSAPDSSFSGEWDLRAHCRRSHVSYADI